MSCRNFVVQAHSHLRRGIGQHPGLWRFIRNRPQTHYQSAFAAMFLEFFKAQGLRSGSDHGLCRRRACLKPPRRGTGRGGVRVPLHSGHRTRACPLPDEGGQVVAMPQLLQLPAVEYGVVCKPGCHTAVCASCGLRRYKRAIVADSALGCSQPARLRCVQHTVYLCQGGRQHGQQHQPARKHAPTPARALGGVQTRKAWPENRQDRKGAQCKGTDSKSQAPPFQPSRRVRSKWLRPLRPPFPTIDRAG